jgi:hypothetical protein
MRQVLTIVFILLSFVDCLSATPTTADVWKKANSYYKQKQYDSAAYYYEQLTQLKPQNAELYYNLGNTYYRLNQISNAVLNYERALHIAPSYKDAEDNLVLAQSQIVNRISPIPDIFFVSWWNGITAGSLAGIWAVLSLILFLLVIGLLIARRVNKIRALPAQLYIGLGVCWIVFMAFAVAASGHRANSCKAVVMQMDAGMYAAPGQNKVQATIPEGTTVELLTEQNNWTEVKLPDGRAGWIQSTQVAKI